MARVSMAQRESYKKADAAAAKQASKIVGSVDLRDAVTAAKREDHVWRWTQRQHAALRAEQRYGVVLDIRHFAEIGARIATGRVIQPGLMLIGNVAKDRLNRRTSVWLAWIGDQEMPLIYDHDTRAVVTVLPWDNHTLEFNGRTRGFPQLANGGTKAARTYWAEVRS